MLDFKAYDVDPVRGFLPSKDPLTALPPEFAEWDHLSAELPYLLLTGRVRRTLKQFRTPDLELLNGKAELERAMLIISALGMAYVWCEGTQADRVPAALAIPWAKLSERLGRPPIVTHGSFVLNNWRRLDQNEEITADNLACLQHFLGGMDEQWFFTATTAIEAIGAAALHPLVEAKTAVITGNIDHLTSLLTTVRQVFIDVKVALERMYERCDPHIFYHRIRPFLAGWDQTGIIFEGVSKTPLKLHGGSAAQSSLIQGYDAALGIEHLHPNTQPFLTLMRKYMPPAHRQFVEDLSKGESIYAFVHAHKADSPQLAEIFNECIYELDQFRRVHMDIAVRYVLKQGKNGEDGLGTGGTSFMPFLSQARRETKAKRT